MDDQHETTEQRRARVFAEGRATLERLRNLDFEVDTGRAPISREGTEDAWGSTSFLGAGGAHFDPCKIGLGGRIVSPAPEPAPQRRHTDAVLMRMIEASVMQQVELRIAEAQREMDQTISDALAVLRDQARAMEALVAKLGELERAAPKAKAQAPAPEPRSEAQTGEPSTPRRLM